MPDRFAGHKIPGVFYAFPSETTTSIALVIGGVIVSVPPYYLNTDESTETLLFLIALGIMTTLAGATTLVGMISWRRTWQSGVEQLGLWMTAGVSASYIYLLIVLGAPPTLPALVFGALGVSSLLRARAIRILTKKKLEELTATNELREELTKHGAVDAGPAEATRPDHPRR